VCTFVSGKHHKSTSFFYDGVPSRKIGRPRFSNGLRPAFRNGELPFPDPLTS